jgi:hypothetical protein
MNDDSENFEELVLANKREWNDFWFWRDKPVGEPVLPATSLRKPGFRLIA